MHKLSSSMENLNLLVEDRDRRPRISMQIGTGDRKPTDNHNYNIGCQDKTNKTKQNKQKRERRQNKQG